MGTAHRMKGQKKTDGRPLIIGLTGSIGMGKSTVAAMFEAEGVPVYDADAEVHRLQGPGGALVDAIETRFPGTTGGEGVDRSQLGSRVLGKPEELAALEAIIHPVLARQRAAFFIHHGDADMVLFDIPLLFEKGGVAEVDVVVVVSAPAEVQRARVLARTGMTPEKFEQILTLQTPDAEKRARADHVIDTGRSLDQTRTAVKRLIESLRDPDGG